LWCGAVAEWCSCSVLQSKRPTALHLSQDSRAIDCCSCSVMQLQVVAVAVCCSHTTNGVLTTSYVLQCVAIAVWCNVLQCVAVTIQMAFQLGSRVSLSLFKEMRERSCILFDYLLFLCLCLCLFLCICVCVCVYVYVCVCVCVCVCAYISVSVSMSVSMIVSVHLCLCLCLCL